MPHTMIIALLTIGQPDAACPLIKTAKSDGQHLELRTWNEYNEGSSCQLQKYL